MFIHSKDFISSGPLTPKQVQPNAVDCTLASISEIVNSDYMYIAADGSMCNSGSGSPPVPVFLREPLLSDGQTKQWPGHFVLEAGAAYSFECHEFVKIPEGVVGWLVGRSTLNRNGIYITSGLYDSGFEGFVGGTMYVFRDVKIEHGARVCQLITAKADSVGLYQGQYSTDLNGVPLKGSAK